MINIFKLIVLIISLILFEKTNSIVTSKKETISGDALDNLINALSFSLNSNNNDSLEKRSMLTKNDQFIKNKLSSSFNLANNLVEKLNSLKSKLNESVNMEPSTTKTTLTTTLPTTSTTSTSSTSTTSTTTTTTTSRISSTTGSTIKKKLLSSLHKTKDNLKLKKSESESLFKNLKSLISKLKSDSVHTATSTTTTTIAAVAFDSNIEIEQKILNRLNDLMSRLNILNDSVLGNNSHEKIQLLKLNRNDQTTSEKKNHGILDLFSRMKEDKKLANKLNMETKDLSNDKLQNILFKNGRQDKLEPTLPTTSTTTTILEPELLEVLKNDGTLDLLNRVSEAENLLNELNKAAKLLSNSLNSNTNKFVTVLTSPSTSTSTTSTTTTSTSTTATSSTTANPKTTNEVVFKLLKNDGTLDLLTQMKQAEKLINELNMAAKTLSNSLNSRKDKNLPNSTTISTSTSTSTSTTTLPITTTTTTPSTTSTTTASLDEFSFKVLKKDGTLDVLNKMKDAKQLITNLKQEGKQLSVQFHSIPINENELNNEITLNIIKNDGTYNLLKNLKAAEILISSLKNVISQVGTSFRDTKSLKTKDHVLHGSLNKN
jgi:trimeric autotransporter adhesin